MKQGPNGSKPEITPPPTDTPGPRRTDDVFNLPPPRLPNQSSASNAPPEPDWSSPNYLNITPGPFVPRTVPPTSINWSWFFFRVVVFVMLFGVVGAAIWYVIGQFDTPQPIATGKGRLVVVVVLDHFRGDLPDRWQKVCDANGFERLRSEGLWFTDAHLPYAITDPAPGYASLSTGTTPNNHGIISQKWIDRGTGKLLEPSQPDLLLSPTIGDALLNFTGSRVVSLALEPDAAQLLGGKASVVAWYDRTNGQFKASRTDRRTWLDDFNASGASTRWQGKDWMPTLVGTVGDQFAGEDDAPGEAVFQLRGSTSFPHSLGAGADYFQNLPATPYGNELLWEFAKHAIEAEHLGSDKTDLLWLGFNATRSIGQTFGPDSQEMLDAVVRMDRLLANMQEFLRTRHGSQNFSIILVGSSGLSPLPERANRLSPEAERINFVEEYGEIERALNTAFGPPEDEKQTWLIRPLANSFPALDWNPARLKTCGVPRQEVFRFAKNWLMNRSYTLQVFDQNALANETTSDRLQRQVQHSYHPDRSADWLIVTKPFTTIKPVGSGSGTPHSSDTHIALMAAGPGIPKLGRQTDRVDGLVALQLIARALGINPPKAATAKLPMGF